MSQSTKKLDLELLKLIMIQIEGEESPDLSKYTKKQILYNQSEILEIGWANGRPLRGDDEIKAVIITSLTFKGHQALEAMRDDTKLNKLKASIQKHGVSFSLSALQIAINQIFGSS